MYDHIGLRVGDLDTAVRFYTAALAPRHWAVCVAMASLVLWVEEIRKLVLRALDARP